jgi:hypothetical protein
MRFEEIFRYSLESSPKLRQKKRGKGGILLHSLILACVETGD